MRRDNAMLQTLIERRDRLEAEIAAMKIRVSEINAIIDDFEKRSGATPAPSSRPKVKSTVLEIVLASNGHGVTASEVVDTAKERGQELDRGSVSSLLSRFKREGTFKLVGDRYFPADPEKSASAVTPLKAA